MPTATENTEETGPWWVRCVGLCRPGFHLRYSLLLLFLIGLILITGCGSPGTGLPAEPSLPPTAIQTASPSPTSTQPASSAEAQPVETGTVEGEGSEPGPSGLEALVPTLADIVPTRTPVPTATPDAVADGVAEILRETGLSGRTLLSLKYADWINLAISLLYSWPDTSSAPGWSTGSSLVSYNGLPPHSTMSCYGPLEANFAGWLWCLSCALPRSG